MPDDPGFERRMKIASAHGKWSTALENYLGLFMEDEVLYEVIDQVVVFTEQLREEYDQTS